MKERLLREWVRLWVSECLGWWMPFVLVLFVVVAVQCLLLLLSSLLQRLPFLVSCRMFCCWLLQARPVICG